MRGENGRREGMERERGGKEGGEEKEGADIRKVL